MDIDKDGENKLKALLADPSVPAPIVLESSGGKYQVIWPLRGITKEQQENVLDVLITKYGGDKAASDCSRVLRLPGFQNMKYTECPEVRIVQEGPDSPYSLSDFKVEVKSVIEKKPWEIYGVEIDGPEIPTGEHDLTLHSIAGKLRSMGEQWDEAAIYDRLLAICTKRIPTHGEDWIDMIKKHSSRISEKPAGVPITTLIAGCPPGENVIPAIRDAIDPATLPNRTERGNGKRFIAKCGDNLKFSYEKKTWFHWNDFVWVEDDQSFRCSQNESCSR